MQIAVFSVFGGSLGDVVGAAGADMVDAVARV